MSLVFKTIQTEGIAELSYLVGDDDAGIAAVFDPRADCDVYVEAAREAAVAITHIFETHIHADLVSGSRELCARLDSAKIYASGEGGAEYDFYLKLPDHVMIYPNHGAGSPCGADIGARLSSTIGYERKFNKFLQFTDAKSFTDYAIQTAPPVPHYYPIMKKINAAGPEVLGNLPRAPGL